MHLDFNERITQVYFTYPGNIFPPFFSLPIHFPVLTLSEEKQTNKKTPSFPPPSAVLSTSREKIR